jgi:hypothetical protein
MIKFKSLGRQKHLAKYYDTLEISEKGDTFLELSSQPGTPSTYMIRLPEDIVSNIPRLGFKEEEKSSNVKLLFISRSSLKNNSWRVSEINHLHHYLWFRGNPLPAEDLSIKINQFSKTFRMGAFR